MNIEEWVEAYGRAWRERDADSAVGLFTEDAEYRFSPFREPVVGSKAIHAYWEGVTSVQEEVDVRMGTPFDSGHIVAVPTGHVPVPGTWTCPPRTPCGQRSEPGAGSRALRSHFVPRKT